MYILNEKTTVCANESTDFKTLYEYEKKCTNYRMFEEETVVMENLSLRSRIVWHFHFGRIIKFNRRIIRKNKQ